MTVDQPHLMSGDYFRTRGIEDSKSAATDDVLLESEEEKSDQPQKMAAVPAVSPDVRAYPLKIGVLLEKDGFSATAAGRLMQAANQAADENMLLVNDTGMREAVASTDCEAVTDIACIAENAALYPGVRMLLTVNQARLPEAFPGQTAVRLTLWDAALMYQYPEIEITDRIESSAEVNAFLEYAMAQVFDYARRKAEVMPSHCRVFSVKENRVYINAGEMTGIPTGETYPVVSGGDTVTSPTGVPVAWVPESEEARIRVERLVGSDAAECTVVNGELTWPGGYVLLNALK
ncbi:MAG: hypothetical protein ACLFNS_13020 [Desulfobacterales bacterium]